MSEIDISVQESLPEGAQLVATAKSVGVAAAPAVKMSFKMREPVAFELPDGRRVGMSLPKAPQSQYIAGILKNAVFEDGKLMAQEQLRVKSLLYVDDIDGKPVDKPHDALSCLKLEQELGDDGCDLVFFAFMMHFPPIDQSQLQIIKKS